MQKKESTCNIHLTIHDFSVDLMTFQSTESLTTGKDRNCWRFYLGDEIIQHSAFVSTVGNSLCIISTARQSWNPSASMNISPHNHINILNYFFTFNFLSSLCLEFCTRWVSTSFISKAHLTIGGVRGVSGCDQQDPGDGSKHRDLINECLRGFDLALKHEGMPCHT